MAAIVYRREHGPWRFGQKLDSENGGERSRRGHLIDPLARGERRGAIHPRSFKKFKFQFLKNSNIVSLDKMISNQKVVNYNVS